MPSTTLGGPAQCVTHPKALYPQHQVHWTLPLPYDIIHLIVASHLDECPDAICSLSLASMALANLCRPLKFRTITLRLPKDRRGQVTLDDLLSLLTVSPSTIDFIRHLRIAGGLIGSTPEAKAPPYDLFSEDTVANLSIFLTTYDLRNLRQLTISLQDNWTTFPTELIRSFAYIFARPTIRTLTVERGTVFPERLLHLFESVSSLEIYGTLDQSINFPSEVIDSPSSHCLPEKLVLRDDSRSGSNLLTLLPVSSSPFRLTRLVELSVSLKGPHIANLNEILATCADTLATLGIYVATWGGLPARLDLQDLRALKSLTLTVDAEMMPYGRMTGTEAPARFNWFVSALETYKTRNSNLNTIGLMLRVRSLQEAQKLPWGMIDDLFASRITSSWINLRVFDVLLVDEDMGANKGILKDILRQTLEPLLPCISKADILGVRRSTKQLEFWRM